MEIVLITGMSGSGKSVALRALEDYGFYCVDNLPPELLIPFVELEQERNEERVAIAIDVRSASSLPMMPGSIDEVNEHGFQDNFDLFRFIFRHLASQVFRDQASPSLVGACGC